MNREDDEKLWDLLGKAPEVKFSPFFARNVLRHIREQSSWSSRVHLWFTWRRLVPLAGLAVAVVGTFLYLQTPASYEDVARAAPYDDVARDVPAVPDAIAKVDVQDYEVVADLDDLLATDESSLWDDTSSSL
jgi:hypothetical protein